MNKLHHKIEVHFVGYLYITNLINARMMGHVKTLRIVVFWDTTPCILVREYRTKLHQIAEDHNVRSHCHEGPQIALNYFFYFNIISIHVPCIFYYFVK